MTVQLQHGNAAPKFTLPTGDGDQISLDDLRGTKVILYFYPAAMSTGCTAEACDFRDNLGSLKGAGYAVNEVGNFLKDAFSLGPEALKGALEGVGYAAGEVKDFFVSIGGSFGDFFGDVGDALDPTGW